MENPEQNIEQQNTEINQEPVPQEQPPVTQNKKTPNIFLFIGAIVVIVVIIFLVLFFNRESMGPEDRIPEDKIETEDTSTNAGDVIDEAIDLSTFRQISDQSSSGGFYYESQDHLVYFYYPQSKTMEEVIGADPETFVFLERCFSGRGSTWYVTDKNAVYVEDEKVEEADVSTFEVVAHYSNFIEQQFSTNYAVDKNSVFHGCGDVVEGADPDSFEYIQGDFAKDKNLVYSGGKIIEGADLQTFEVVGGRFSKDSNRIYFGPYVLDGADTDSFEYVAEVFAKDKDYVYAGRSLQGGVDPADCTKEKSIDIELLHEACN